MPFMTPEVVKGCYVIEDEYGEGSVYPISLNAPILGETCEYSDFLGPVVSAEIMKDKYIGRYHAKGYMDSTCWSGPYDSEEECLKGINNLFGDCDEENDE
jgi:hypothetical protein